MEYPSFTRSLESVIKESEDIFTRLQDINASLFRLTSSINLLAVENEHAQTYDLKAATRRLGEAAHHLEHAAQITVHLKALFQYDENPPSRINQGMAVGYTRIAYRYFRNAHRNVHQLEELTKVYVEDRHINAFERIRLLGKMYDRFIETESYLCEGIFALRIAYNHAFSRQIMRQLLDQPLEVKNLRKGDIVLSYKTSPYLHHHFLSRIISIAQHKNITHSAIVCSVDGDNVKIIAASGEAGVVGVFDLKASAGERWFVFRPLISPSQSEALNVVIDRWTSDIHYHPGQHRFAELKSWIAVLVGYLFSEIVIHANVVVMIPNVVTSNRDYFCSDIIDKMFKEVGVQLVPRSRNDAVVGPAELFYSPFLKNIGIIYNKEEASSVLREDWEV